MTNIQHDVSDVGFKAGHILNALNKLLKHNYDEHKNGA